MISITKPKSIFKVEGNSFVNRIMFSFHANVNTKIMYTLTVDQDIDSKFYASVIDVSA